MGNTAGGLTGVGQAISIYDKSTRSAGYIEQYSFDIQRQFGGSWVLSAGLIGSHGLHLVQDGRNIDQLNPQYLSLGSALNSNVANPLYQHGGVLNVGNPTISRSQLLLPFPQFTSVTLLSSDTNHSSYNSLHAKVQRRFAQGMTILATYTWSRQTDLAYGNVGNSFSAAPAGPQNAYDLSSEYGLSTTDSPNRLSLANTYELPFGKGRKFLANNRIVDFLVGGWSANVVGVMQSGYPLAISQPNNNSVFGASTQRPNATGVSAAVDLPFDKRIDGWINPAAFSRRAAVHLRQRQPRHHAARTGSYQLGRLDVQDVFTVRSPGGRRDGRWSPCRRRW